MIIVKKEESIFFGNNQMVSHRYEIPDDMSKEQFDALPYEEQIEFHIDEWGNAWGSPIYGVPSCG